MKDGMTMSIERGPNGWATFGIMEFVEKHETDHSLFRLMFRIKDLHI